MIQHWIPIEKIIPLIGLESFVIATSLSVSTWGFYKLFLREISIKRHANLQRRFVRLLAYLVASAVFALICWQIREHSEWGSDLRIGASYFGLISLTLGVGATIFLAQISIYLYLFFANMRAGVPRLIANIFTLIFATVTVGWLSAELFQFRIVPLLATSAIFSVILGLALQDTLGNLFSGLALQLDSPYLIGDWVEIQNGSQSWTGQIQEITWRATVLQGFANELITVPNRTMAQSQVIMYAANQRQARRGQAFRIPFGTSIESAKAVLKQVVLSIPQIPNDPPPSFLVTSANDSWVTLKVFYSVDDFGAQYRIADDLLTRALVEFEKAGIRLAHPTVELLSYPS